MKMTLPEPFAIAPVDLHFLEQRKYTEAEICKVFSIPQAMLLPSTPKAGEI